MRLVAACKLVLSWRNIASGKNLLVLRALMDAAKLLPLDIESGIGAEKAMLRLTN